MSILLHIDSDYAVIALNIRYIEFVSLHPEKGYLKQVLYTLRNLSEPVLKLICHIHCLVPALYRCNPLVYIQLLNLVYDVLCRNIGIHIDIYLCGKIANVRFVALELHYGFI